MQFKNILKLFRIKQWIKNVFVLAPLLYSGAYADLATLSKSTFCFIVFCLASSSTYILNDYLDRDSDRKHPVKRIKRPIASGEISEKSALTLLVLTYLATVGLLYIEPTIVIPVLAYLVLNIAYCLYPSFRSQFQN